MKSLFLVLLCPALINAQELVRYVNPLIGTQKMGHTYPGATVPFGAVQLSPDTDTIPYERNGRYNPEVYRYCAGYQYDDPTIVGFSHTHFSGTGHSDLGDFLLMPTVGKLQLNPGVASNPLSGFRSAYSHRNEMAQAGYYKVLLEDDHILAELTATTRVGMHQYKFPKSDQSHIILDLMHGIYNYAGKNVWTYVRVINDTLITGYRQTNGWARTRTVYFAMSFSKPFKSYGQKNFETRQTYRGFWRKFDQDHNFPEIAGQQIRMHFDFETDSGEQIGVKLALSPVSRANAVENMKTEIPHWDFDKAKSAAQAAWESELSRIHIDAPQQDKTNFYTALYHTMLGPTVYQDVNGQYKGVDQNVHTADGFTNYTTFSLWDTYRALHPLLNLIQPVRNADMVQSMLAHFDQSALKMLPIWSHYANDNWCMSGYHAVSVITDAIVKGVYKGDAQKALEACVATADKRIYEGIGVYIDRGFVPSDRSGTSVSNTLEYAYDDWCIAQLSAHIGKSAAYARFADRSGNWKNVFNPATGFMQERLSDGRFKSGADVLGTHGQGFIEGNSWNYSFFVPHDPEALARAMGGRKKFRQRLDALFAMHLPDAFFAETEDITREGIIGGYVHGNEPAHHVAYLYNWTDRPWKGQAQIRKILQMQYKNAPDGLGGNDDCGQMSAWYVFSALGFYPVAPGSSEYAIGSPLVTSASVQLEHGATLQIKTVNQSARNVYVKKVEFNGKRLDKWSIAHRDIVQGGSLVFYMSDRP